MGMGTGQGGGGKAAVQAGAVRAAPAARHGSAHLDGRSGRPVRSEQGCTSCTGLGMLRPCAGTRAAQSHQSPSRKVTML